jgi:hypothetical protein
LGHFLSFKWVSSCLLVISDIPTGLGVSNMSHCDVTLVFVKMTHLYVTDWIWP